ERPEHHEAVLAGGPPIEGDDRVEVGGLEGADPGIGHAVVRRQAIDREADLAVELDEPLAFVDRAAHRRRDEDLGPAAAFLEVVEHGPRDSPAEPRSASLRVDEDDADPARA